METTQILKRPAPFLPDFARRQWTSSSARSMWEPRIARIGTQFLAAERESVELGVRQAALQNIKPEDLPELSKRAGRRGLVVIPLSMQGRSSSYAASPVEIAEGGPWDYRIAFTLPKDAAAFVEAWGAQDDNAIGELLGYPECCRRFFLNTWAAGSVDPTWHMCSHGKGPREANILLRWLGVRYVPHMPCSFNCSESVALGQKLRELVAPRERSWADELLDAPMMWSSLNGIGEVVTPIVTLNFRSDAEDLREIRREGLRYLEHGAHGIKFPYRPPPARRPDPNFWLDNGFGSLKPMQRAHRAIIAVRPPESSRIVLDLGCGNGHLAQQLAGAGGKAIGVEADPVRAQRAENLLDEVLNADIFDVDLSAWSPDLTLLMPGRLVELIRAELPARLEPDFATRLRAMGGELLVYAYGDWLEKHGSLEDLCKAAGLAGELVDVQKAVGVEAGVWSWAK